MGSLIPSFIIIPFSVEVMACSIHQNDKIQGIQIKNEEVKLSLFADDMTCFLKNKSSYQDLSSSLKCFSKFSGLKLKANFEAILRSIKRTLSIWKWRGLLLLGKYKLSNHLPFRNLCLKPPLFMFRMILYR